MRVGLIDADITIFQAAVIAQKDLHFDTDEDEAYAIYPQRGKDAINEMVTSTARKLKLDRVVMCLTDSENWRHGVDLNYKMNRTQKRPYLLKELRGHVEKHYEFECHRGLEADDVMGILATEPSDDRRVICSIDKDMQTIPGWLYDGKSKPRKITPEKARWYHAMQTLTGDTVDGYSGCKGIGEKKAKAILSDLDPIGDGYWLPIVTAYEEAGQTEDDALRNARLAYILQHGDYDFTTNEVKLWLPQ